MSYITSFTPPGFRREQAPTTKPKQPLAKLVAITKPVIEDVETAEDFVAYAARVSNPANQNNAATGSKLIRYLVDNHHWSPLEMVSLTMEFNTTRDIGRQILRHRSMSFQEFSGRYAENLGFAEPREARLQDKKNRQNSIMTSDEAIIEAWDKDQRTIIANAGLVYRNALDSGIAKEQARAVLPEGLIETRMYVAGTLRSWVHYCLLRMAHGTQKEHMEIAKAAWAIICEQFPSISGLFNPLDLYIDEFVLRLKKKLRQKTEEGYESWNDLGWTDEMRLEAISEELDLDADPIDLAAYSIFLDWYNENTSNNK